MCMLAVLGLAFGLSSCQKAPELTITGPTSVEINADGGNGSITFMANRDWKATTSDSWISVSPSSGTASEGTITLSVRCNANTTYEDRTATVTIRAEELMQTISVRQSANLGLIVPTKSFDIPSDASSIEVEVQSNIQYTVTISGNWIKQINTKGLIANKLTFSIEENKTYGERIATIIISGSGLSQSISVKQAGKDNTPEGAVNLGLSVYWGICNLGATQPEEYGDYYAWGETETKTDYNWTTYKWYKDSLTKYNTVDNKNVLEEADDVAHVKLGGKWRMPTDAEWKELRDNCTWTWTTQNGIKGRLVTGKNGKSIFLPAAGNRYFEDYGLLDAGSKGSYWSSSASSGYPKCAWNSYFLSNTVDVSYSARCYGFSVRPVTE